MQYFTFSEHWQEDFNSETLLIKKVFGKWKLIERFDFSMT